MKCKIIISTLAILLGSALGLAAPIKVAVIAPEGSSWANNLKAMAKEISEQTKGEVEFKIYYGAS